MTEAQRLREIGFNASLQCRGVLFNPPDGAAPVMALVETTSPNGGEFEMAQGLERETAWLHVLRSQLGDTPATPQSVWTRAEDGVSYRITDVDNHPDKIEVSLLAEVGLPSE